MHEETTETREGNGDRHDMNELKNTYDPNADKLDFDRVAEYTRPTPNLLGVLPPFAAASLGYAMGAVTWPKRHVSVHLGPGGITVFDGTDTIQSEWREPEFSRRSNALSIIATTYPISEILRGRHLGDGEIPSHQCDTLVIDQFLGNVWALPYDDACDLVSSDNTPAPWFVGTEEEAFALLKEWAFQKDGNPPIFSLR